MKDIIHHTVQSFATRSRWTVEIMRLDETIELPKDYADVDYWEEIAMKLYAEATKQEIKELVLQCQIVGLKELASHFEMSLGIATLEGSQELMNNN